MIKAVAAVVCVLAMGPVAAQAQDASGKWEATFYTQQGPLPATVVLKKEGEKLTGSVSSQQGDLAVSGTQKGNAISLNATFDAGNGPVAILITGTQNGDSMTGSVDFGGQAQADWGAKRVPAAGSDSGGTSSSGTDGNAAGVSGTWALEVTTPAGSGTPTVTLKQDGETLTGQYSGQMGEAPLTGTIKGTAFTFRFNVSVQGTALDVVYSGTVEKDAMKGTVKMGDLGEGTFTGRRK